MRVLVFWGLFFQYDLFSFFYNDVNPVFFDTCTVTGAFFSYVIVDNRLQNLKARDVKTGGGGADVPIGRSFWLASGKKIMK